MSPGNRFRRILPISQTAIAMFFGGWGLWARNSILSRPFFGNSTLWDSTARFHVWPWPFKFAAVLNMPAFLTGSLLSWPLDPLWPGLPESVSIIPALLCVPLPWSWVGSWLDRRGNAEKISNAPKWQWILLFVFTFICAAASSIRENVGGYVSYVPAGMAIWLVAAIGMAAFKVRRKPA